MPAIAPDVQLDAGQGHTVWAYKSAARCKRDSLMTSANVKKARKDLLAFTNEVRAILPGKPGLAWQDFGANEIHHPGGLKRCRQLQR